VHADPHPGNVLLMDDQRLALFDLGMVAHLPPHTRRCLLQLLLGAIGGNGAQVSQISESMGTPLQDFRRAQYARRVDQLVSDYVGEQHVGRAYSEGRLVLELTRVGAACGLRSPAELPLLGKTLLNLEAVMDALDPAMPTKQIIEDHLQSVMQRQFKQMFSANRLASDMIEVQELLRESPRRLSQLLRTLSDNRFRVHITGLEESRLIESMQKIANRISVGVVTAGLIMGAALIMRVPTTHLLLGYPALALVLFLLAFGGGAGLVVSSLINDRRTKPREERDPI
jgi:predicted unusual protein kinase regulating ubiquinone biosynthesis (AarF/ABC1/UbiB family)